MLPAENERSLSEKCATPLCRMIIYWPPSTLGSSSPGWTPPEVSVPRVSSGRAVETLGFPKEKRKRRRPSRPDRENGAVEVNNDKEIFSFPSWSATICTVREESFAAWQKSSLLNHMKAAKHTSNWELNRKKLVATQALQGNVEKLAQSLGQSKLLANI